MHSTLRMASGVPHTNIQPKSALWFSGVLDLKNPVEIKTNIGTLEPSCFPEAFKLAIETPEPKMERRSVCRGSLALGARGRARNRIALADHCHACDGSTSGLDVMSQYIRLEHTWCKCHFGQLAWTIIVHCLHPRFCFRSVPQTLRSIYASAFL